MGVGGSTGGGPGGGALGIDGASLLERWGDGAPFTLLHDEGFVAEKYQEIVRHRGQDNETPVEEDDHPLEAHSGGGGGTDGAADEGDDRRPRRRELPRAELEELADAVRIELLGAAGGDGDRDPDNEAPAYSVLQARAGTSLARDAPVRAANERLRSQRVEIIREYFAALARAMDESRSAHAISTSATTASTAADGESTEGSGRDHRLVTPRPPPSAPARGQALSSQLFSVSAFRMQLVMLQELRPLCPSMFERGLLTIIETVLEFPSFALHGIDKDSPDARFLDDVRHFCRDLLETPTTLAPGHRDVLLLLLFALGVCSGRAELLLEFVLGMIRREHVADSATSILGGKTMNEWIDVIRKRLGHYRVPYTLGSLKEESMLRQIPIKMVKDAEDGAARQHPGKDRQSIATDGTYVYLWNLRDGMMKVGTGHNFTIAGRIYAHVPPSYYLKALQAERKFLCGFFGSGSDVTAMVHQVLSGNELTQKTVKQALAVSAEKLSGMKLCVVLRKNEDILTYLLGDQDILCVPTEAVNNGFEVLFGFYGDFDILGSDLIARIQSQQSDSAEKVHFDDELFSEMMSTFDKPESRTSDSDELYLVYSVGDSSTLFLERFSRGEWLSPIEDQSEHIYYSSLVLCDDYLYLSLLHPVTSHESSDGETLRHKPRTLFQLSTHDLRLLGSIQLDAGDIDAHRRPVGSFRITRPLFTYASDGTQIFEIEMSADLFRIRVFLVSVEDTSSVTTFKRSFDLEIKNVQCATFVSCFLQVLKMDLRLGDLDFMLPTFVTNGALITMTLPSITSPVTTDRETALFDCIMFNCETGDIVGVGDDVVGTLPSDISASPEVHEAKSFERSLPGMDMAFDPRNLVIWVASSPPSTLTSYGSPGRKIRLDDLEIKTDAFRDDGCDVCVDVLRTIVCCGLAETNDDSRQQSHAPFAPTIDSETVHLILDLMSKFAAKYQTQTASHRDLISLRLSLELVSRVIYACKQRNTVNRDIDAMFQDRLPLVLSILTGAEKIAETTNYESPADFDQHRLAIVSAALTLEASVSRIFRTNFTQQVDRIIELLSKAKQSTLTSANKTIGSRFIDQAQRNVGLVDDEQFLSPGLIERLTNILSLVVEFHISCINACGHKEYCLHSNGLVQEAVSFLNCAIQRLFVQLFTSVNAFKAGLDMFNASYTSIHKIAVNACATAINGAPSDLTDKVERVLRSGFLRLIAPVVLGCGVVFLRSIEDTLGRLEKNSNQDKHERIHVTARKVRELLHKFIPELLPVMTAALDELMKLTGILKTESRCKSVEAVTVTTKNEVMESSHEYDNNIDETKELRIPGATRITIQFDPRSRTEYNYDYVTFYKDKTQTNFYGEQFYSGRDEELNWPGVRGNPPLVIESDHCFVYFHSDASNTDWGFKFTATGEIFEKKASSQRHWLDALVEMSLAVTDETARILVKGVIMDEYDESEAINERYLDSELLRHGTTSNASQSTDVVTLLRNFVAPPESSAAERVVRALQQCGSLPRFRSSSTLLNKHASEAKPESGVNPAIQAVAAAILHHNMWGMDAYALAHNLRSDVSEQLLRGWKNAQKIRDWFHLGDAAEGARPGSPKERLRRPLRRQPSAYKGMSDDALQTLCRNVIDRAMFLLELTPMSFSYVSGAKRRWGLLAKYGTAISSQGSTSQESPLTRWYNLLDELQEATELRSLLHYRRSSCERRKTRQIKSVTEQVLEFIQSDADVGELRDLVNRRNRRASIRALGFETYDKMWNACPRPSFRITVVESLLSALTKLAIHAAQQSARIVLPTESSVLPPPRLHFGSLLSGCDGDARKRVNEAFARCLTSFSRSLDSINGNGCASGDLVVAILRTVSLDYDVDDAYLLHESKILTQLLRFLRSESVPVRRSAQALLDTFLSRLLAAKMADSDETGTTEGDTNEDPTAFQKQLFATVTLQLEGVVSFLREMENEPGGCSWSVGPHFLASGYEALVSKITPYTDLKWNHTILMWLNVTEEEPSNLRIGDEVRRGPQWHDGCEEDGGPGELGIVKSIFGCSRVQVEWMSTKILAEYAYDPCNSNLEVIHVDDGVAGVVFSKGTRSLVKDTTFATPWSYIGLFLNDKRQLSYKISCGSEKDSVYDTNFDLEADEWTHVAIVQDSEVLRFYINGLLASQHILDPFLIARGHQSSFDGKIIESLHPVVESTDQYWPVHMPGASKIRVTFDPLSEIDQSAGFVRFFKNARCTEWWGEGSYSGRYHDPERNFPGGQSNRHRGRRSVVAATVAQNSLEIPNDRFLVYFHYSGGNSCWGFRLLVTAEYPSSVSSPTSSISLNQFPFFFGEPPCRVADDAGARCWIYQPEVLNRSLTEDEIVAEMQESCPNSPCVPGCIATDRVLHVLGLIQRCCRTSFGQTQIATPENIANMLFLAMQNRAPVEARCACIAVLKKIWPVVTPEVVNQHFQSVTSGRNGFGIVHSFFSTLSSLSDIWGHYFQHEREWSQALEVDDETPPCPLELQHSAQEVIALICAFSSLLRSMVVQEDWKTEVVRWILTALQRMKTSFGSSNHQDYSSTVADAMAALSLFGGCYEGVIASGRVKACVNIDGKETIETGYLLRFRVRNGARLARVLFDCDPSKPVDVPVNDVSNENTEAKTEIATFIRQVEQYLPQIRDALSALLDLRADLNSDIVYEPKVTRKENVEVLESQHPYAGGEDVTYPLRFHGAQEILIFFDQLSSTLNAGDYVRFLKRDDDNRSNADGSGGHEYWGEPIYWGDSFPGIGMNPPLRIPAQSVDVHFHTEQGVQQDWGFKLTAHAYEETLMYPPEHPPHFIVNAVNDVRARVLKALDSIILSLSTQGGDTSIMEPILNKVIDNAISRNDGRPTRSTPKSQVFESKHPYANSVLEYMAVTFSGASQLTITFDPKSQTEDGTDYLCFFKDKALTDRWGAEQYSGSGSRANWPGTSGRPPLVIPADSFTLLWSTDATNVDWGWKFTVTAEYPSVAPLSLRLDQLEKRSYDLWEIFYEGVLPQPKPFPEEYDGYKRVSDKDAIRNHLSQDDAVRSTIRAVTTEKKAFRIDHIPSKFRVVAIGGVDIQATCSTSSEIIGRVNEGEEFHSDQECCGWLRVSVQDKSSTKGWIRRRNGDDAFVINLRDCFASEDTILVGVDEPYLLSSGCYFGIDSTNEEHEALTTFVSQFSYEMLKGQTNRLQSLAYDTHRALAIKIARETALRYMATAHTRAPMTFDVFGSPENFLLVLVYLFQEKDANRLKGILERTATRLRTLFASLGGHPDFDRILDICVSILRYGHTQLPLNYGAVRIVESPHPYMDDADQSWIISIPGAKQVRICFDPRSKTEAGCDYVSFYKTGTERKVCYGEPQYSGRSGSENWPGCGGRAPLTIDADTVEVYFHSDSSQNDWGFKLFAIGLFDSEAAPASRCNDSVVCLMEMSLYLLLIAASIIGADGHCPSTDTIADRLFSCDVFETLLFSLQWHPRRIKHQTLKVLTSLVQHVEYLHTIPSPVIEKLRCLLFTKVRAQHQIEDRLDTKSEYFQTMIQCVLFTDLSVDSGSFSAISTGSQYLQTHTNENICSQYEPLPESSFHFQLVNISNDSIVQFASKGVVYLEYQCSGSIVITRSNKKVTCSSVDNDDIVTISGDIRRRVLVVRKNYQVVVSVLASDWKDYGLCSWEIVFGDDLDTLEFSVDSSHSAIAIKKRPLHCSPLAGIPMPIIPNWYNKVCEAMSLILDFEENRVSQVEMRESHHPLHGDDYHTLPERVQIQGAIALEIHFDRHTQLLETQQLRFTDSINDVAILPGLSGPQWAERYSYLFTPDPLKRAGILKVGDRVVRSADWIYGDEDGGCGSVGKIKDIVSWKDRNGCGVLVQWVSSGEERLYRYGYDGYFDVQVAHSSDLDHTPLIIAGDTLEYILEAVGPNSMHNAAHTSRFRGTLRIDTTHSELSLDLRKTKLMLGDDCTIEFWISADDDLFTRTSSRIVPIFHLTTLDPSSSLTVYCGVDGSVSLESSTNTSTISMARSVSDLPPTMIFGQWTHVAIVVSSSKVVVYIDGKWTVEGRIGPKSLQGVYVSSILFGRHDAVAGVLRAHLCDLRIWDVELRAEQIQSHANGLDGVATDTSLSVSSPTPRNLHKAYISPGVIPPSPPRSPRSPSRALSIPPHLRKWVTTNRSGRDLMNIRAMCPIPIARSDDIVYFEAHILSGGRVCVGWSNMSESPSSRESLVGDQRASFGLELPRKIAHLDGEIVETELPQPTGFVSPRTSTSSSSIFFGDVFGRDGDVIGCALSRVNGEVLLFVNGDLVAKATPSPSSEEHMEDKTTQAHIASPTGMQRHFDKLVDEMLSLGFSRSVSEEALDATGVNNVPGALKWILDESVKPDGSIGSPRRDLSQQRFGSPRRRASSSSGSARVLLPPHQATCFVPCASLGAQGAQGIAWNFGQHPFRHPPHGLANAVVSVLEATNTEECDVRFEIFEHGEKRWERVAYRHRVQDLTPSLLAWWKLDEGSGTNVYDSSGRGQVGTIHSMGGSMHTPLGASMSPMSPTRKRLSNLVWDRDSVPPVAVTRRGDDRDTEERPVTSSVIKEPPGWGYRFYIIPHFNNESIGRRRFVPNATLLVDSTPTLSLRHDQHLVKYVNKVAASKQLGLSQLLRSGWHEFSPSEQDLVRWPVLVEIASGEVGIGGRDPSEAASLLVESTRAAGMERLGQRFRLLQVFNGAIGRLLPFVAFDYPRICPCEAHDHFGKSRSLSQLVVSHRARIFNVVKRNVWDMGLRRTSEAGLSFELTLNRPKAMRHRICGKTDVDGRYALFSQAFRQLSSLDGAHFRRKEAIYYVRFLGENAEDAGGPYRETFAQYAEELHSSQLPLMLLSMNAQHNVGAGREKWVLNPGATTATQLQMFEFLGKLMGVAIRSQEYLALKIAQLIWKKLVGETVGSEDLALIDSMVVSSMSKMRTIEKLGVTEELFEDIVMETFTTLSADNRLVPLKPDGASSAVTFHNRFEFADLVERYRLGEFDLQVAAIQRGLGKVVPIHLLSLFTGAELELLVCGTPEVDVDLLQRCTEYSSCSPTDQHIVWFWEALRGFSHDERSAFLRFVWGRSRLPATEKEFPQSFKLQSFNKQQPGRSADAYLPVAHTCFFAVEIPAYSSLEILRDKLLYAMFNCQEIDADGDSVAANQLGWEE